MPYVPDENAVIYLEAVPSSIDKGGCSIVFIHGEKGNGYPLPDGTIVSLSATSGEIPGEVELMNGKAQATFASDSVFSGEVQITARSGQAQIIPEVLGIIVVDRDIASLMIWAEPAEVPATGGQSDIEVLALDSFQSPVADKTVFLSTSQGTLSGGGARLTDSQGRVHAVLSTEKAATVTVTYGSLSSSVTVRIATPNVKPVADFSFSPSEPGSGETVYFNASASYDSDGTIVSYEWDFGDGTAGSGETVSHVYTVSQTKTFIVLLKVIDNDGGEGVKTKEIEITVI